MKVYSLTEFKCSFCSQWFDPYSPHLLPYKLSCSHSICSTCLKSTKPQGSLKIICPQDLTLNIYKSPSHVPLNTHIKQLLQKILGSPKNIQTNEDYLEIIKQYSKKFEKKKEGMSVEINLIFSFIDKLFEEEVGRLRDVLERFKIQLNRPVYMINDWKENVKNYLKSIRSEKVVGEKGKIEYYLEEARKVELEISEFMKIDKDVVLENVVKQRNIGFREGLSLENLNVVPASSSHSSELHLKPSPKQLFIPSIDQSKKLQYQSLNLHPSNPSFKNNTQPIPHLSQSIESSTLYLSKNPLTQISFDHNKPPPSSSNINSAQQKLKSYINHPTTKHPHHSYDKQNNKLIQSIKSQNQFFSMSDGGNDEMLISYNPHEEKNLDTILETHSDKDYPSHPTKHKLINFISPSKSLKPKTDTPIEVIRKPYVTSQTYLKQYTDKTKSLNIQEALQHTLVKQNQIQLLYPLQKFDFSQYLQQLVVPNEVEMIKMVKVGMCDEQFNLLLNFVMRNRGISTLVVSHNRLTEQCLEMIVRFMGVSGGQLKNVYLSKNWVGGRRGKELVQEIRRGKVNVYV